MVIHENKEHTLYKSDSIPFEEKKTENVCDFCEYMNNDPEAIKKHTAQEHGRVYCDRCDYGALDKSILDEHKMQHTSRNNFICGKCEFEATRQEIMENHKYSKHPVINDDKAPTSKQKCSKCEVEFTDAFYLDITNVS